LASWWQFLVPMLIWCACMCCSLYIYSIISAVVYFVKLVEIPLIIPYIIYNIMYVIHRIYLIWALCMYPPFCQPDWEVELGQTWPEVMTLGELTHIACSSVSAKNGPTHFAPGHFQWRFMFMSFPA
jgi:hypothetical protein